jgi:uncharacterized protein
MNKRLRLGVVLALGASGGWAVDWKARYPKPEGPVSDFAHAIDAASKNQIEAYAAGVEKATGARMTFVTIPSLEREPVEDVAKSIFRAWGADRNGDGEAGNDNGIMLLLAIGDQRSHLEVGNAFRPILPDSLAGDVLREMRPALRKDAVGDAMAAAAETIGAAIAQAKHVHLTVQPPARRYRPETSDHVNWLLILGIVALILLFSRFAGPRSTRSNGVAGLGALPWLLFGKLTGGRSSYGCRGSGGFGGFDSGDGFGGFGGGDSGHGRPSSDW